MPASPTCDGKPMMFSIDTNESRPDRVSLYASEVEITLTPVGANA
jgi:hypothetical protein